MSGFSLGEMTRQGRGWQDDEVDRENDFASVCNPPAPHSTKKPKVTPLPHAPVGDAASTRPVHVAVDVYRGTVHSRSRRVRVGGPVSTSPVVFDPDCFSPTQSAHPTLVVDGVKPQNTSAFTLSPTSWGQTSPCHGVHTAGTPTVSPRDPTPGPSPLPTPSSTRCDPPTPQVCTPHPCGTRGA